MFRIFLIQLRQRLLLIAATATSIMTVWVVSSSSATGIPYSGGSYGTCTYDTCGITMVTSGSVAIDVTPTPGSTTCTVNKDTVAVTTGASTGYAITLTASDTSNTLTGPASINASSGTPESPVALSANTWGYRVDGISSFGAGPTSTLSSGPVPSQMYAGVPVSSGTPGLIRATSVADSETVNTSVWYGVCADNSLQSGTYTDSVTYTAVIN